MIATTPEQSKRLMKKISTADSDMCYQNYIIEAKDEKNLKKEYKPVGGLMIGNPYQDFPAWSLSKLWDLVREKCDKKHPFVFDTNMTSDELVEHLVKILTYEEEGRLPFRP